MVFLPATTRWTNYLSDNHESWKQVVDSDRPDLLVFQYDGDFFSRTKHQTLGVVTPLKGDDLTNPKCEFHRSSDVSCSTTIAVLLKVTCHLFKYFLPIVQSRLPVEADGRIPRRVGAVRKPAPVAGRGKRDPNRYTQRSR